jgi:CRP/FNR family transcriptional regulator, cyclic AMP receptor protein
MMTADQTQTQITLGFIDSCTDSRTGFLPSRAPMSDLPAPFDSLSTACSELTGHLHGPEKNCRPWLDQKFADVNPDWATALEQAENFVLENLMTKASLLCHAYRCGRVPCELEPVPELPPGLDWLWTQLSKRLEIPRVGSYYSLLVNNWKLHGVKPGGVYHISDLSEGTILPMVGWLTSPSHDDLKGYLSTVVKVEAKGARILESMKEVYDCMIRDNTQEATYHLMVLSANILAINTAFNRSFKNRSVNIKSFESLVRPLLLWSPDDPSLRGGNDLQSCTVQVLESFFGVQRESNFGQLTLLNQKYLSPSQQKLLKVMDQTSVILRKFVEDAQSVRLTEAYNRCLNLMQSWRVSNQKRGALLNEHERKLNVNTRSGSLDNKWEGLEWSLDFLFRFLTEEQRDILNRNAETLNFKAGEAIISQGNLFPGLFELKSGSATVKKQVGRNEEIVDRMAVHEVFGEMSLVENLPASASIIADVDLEARHMSLETVYDLINDHRDAEAGFYLALAQLISHRFRKTFPIQG